jgi:hypothetical protein
MYLLIHFINYLESLRKFILHLIALNIGIGVLIFLYLCAKLKYNKVNYLFFFCHL